MVYVMPTLQFNVMYVGGPNVVLKGFVEANVVTSNLLPSLDPCRSVPFALGFSSNLGVQVVNPN